MRFFNALLFLLTPLFGLSQIVSTTSKTIETALIQKATLQENALVKDIAFTNIGPTIIP